MFSSLRIDRITVQSFVLGVLLSIVHTHLSSFIDEVIFFIIELLLPREVFWDHLWGSISNPQVIFEFFVLAPVILISVFIAAVVISVLMGVFYQWRYDKNILTYTMIIIAFSLGIFNRYLDPWSTAPVLLFILNFGFPLMLWLGLSKGFKWAKKIRGEH